MAADLSWRERLGKANVARGVTRREGSSLGGWLAVWGGPGWEGGRVAEGAETPDRTWPTVTVAAPVCREEQGTDVGLLEPWWNRQLWLPGQG